ncbi:MAG: Plug domain-containing protein, partial [Calditrichota bacterium]
MNRFRIAFYFRFFCISVLGITGLLFAQIPGVESGRRVVYAEDIERSGILRLSELFRLVDDWNITSVDDYVWQYSAGGLSDFSNQHIEVLVDGQPVYLGVLTAIDLNALPIGIAVVDSVEFFSTPLLVRGRFADRGLIHIHTKIPESGFDYHNLSWYGNETGDPGPFIFTERRSRNIDRVGPDYSNFASYRYSEFFIRAGLIDQNHYSTDGRVRDRNPGLGNSDLWLRRYLPSLQVHFPAFGGFHKLLVMHNSTKEFLGDELNGSNPLFFEPLGGEIPTERIATSAGLSGEVGADTAMVLRYRLRLSRDQFFETVDRTAERRLDWELDIAQASLESILKRKTYSADVGVLWQRLEPSSEFFFGADNYTTSAIFASLLLKPWSKLNYKLDGQLTTNNNQSSLKLSGGVVTGGKKRLLELQASYTERLFSENNDLWFWQDQ